MELYENSNYSNNVNEWKIGVVHEWKYRELKAEPEN